MQALVTICEPYTAVYRPSKMEIHIKGEGDGEKMELPR